MTATSDTAPEPADLEAWLKLLRAPGIGPVWGFRLLREAGGPREIFESGRSAWTRAGLPKILHAGLSAPDEAGVARDLEWLAGTGRALVTLDDPRYPAALRDIPQPPLALFCHGRTELLAAPQIAVVGARAATTQGLDNARDFAASLARAGLTVTSGLALGIDGAAHRAALDAQGTTIAVCGTGLDRVYPARHRALAHDVAGNGLLVSEFPCGTAPLRENFPRRNRIISGLALGVLVVEAAPGSGSLITARLALEQGREVFAVPGSIHNPAARGCHALIRQGARLVESARDVLEELAPRLPAGALAALGAPAERASSPALPRPHAEVLAAIGDAATGFDLIAERVKLSIDELSSALLILELEGHIAAAPGGAYVRRRRS